MVEDAGPQHTPVMLEEVIESLAPRAGATVVDGTVGLGGHALDGVSRPKKTLSDRRPQRAQNIDTSDDVVPTCVGNRTALTMGS